MTATREPVDSPERLFLEQLPLIDRILAVVARRHALTGNESEEFASWARARLTDNDYAVLRKFAGRSSWATYLSVVVANLFRDYRNSIWGRWRPSAGAQRLGPVAIRLEELLVRDEAPLREAIAVLRSAGVTESEGELARMAALLPHRASPRELSVPAVADSLPDASTKRPLSHEERARVFQALSAALRALSNEERVVLRMRYWDGRSVADIARILHVEQKPLYRRLEANQRQLRELLAQFGVSADDVRELMSEEALW